MTDNPHPTESAEPAHDRSADDPAESERTLRNRVVHTGRRLSRRVEAGGSKSTDLRSQVRQLQTELADLQTEFRQLQAEVHQDRRLHRRVAELTDVVAELLLPAAQRDEEKLVALLDGYGGS